jgi:glycosyltransferase involved in cell wall biosynthesis
MSEVPSPAPRPRSRVVVATADALTERMAGPAIRAWRIALELSAEHEVKLVSTSRADITHDRFEIVQVPPGRGLAALVEWSDVFVFQGWVMAGQRYFQRPDRIFVVDVYDPLHLEQLEQGRDVVDAQGEDGRWRQVFDATAVLNEQLARGDYFLCASDKQRDLWMGALASLGRVNPATYDADPGLDSLIGVVPFGISDDPPVRTRAAIKGVLPGVGADDSVIIWGGGVYNWFDPLTLIRAVDRLRRRRPDVRLVFLGMRHPSPMIPEMQMATDARCLADELGLTDRFVIFNEEWVAYDDRQNYLLDADVAVSTHLHHVETDYSFRTRILDYFWASLPTVATNGDALADLIERRQLGLTVAPGDVEALEGALFRLLDEPDLAAACRANVAEVVPELRWSKVLEPVVEFCRAPHRAPDLLTGRIDPSGAHLTRVERAPHGLRHDLGLAVKYVREGGVALMVRKIGDRVTRVVGARRGTGAVRS